MNTRKKIVAGNWKMNPVRNEALKLFDGILQGLPENPASEIIIAPPYVYLDEFQKKSAGLPIQIAAQNAHWENSGAYTGEISPAILKSIGIKTVIIGHSERRQYFGETDDVLRKKIHKALENDLRIIFCVGELLKDREKGAHFEVVKNQLKNVLSELNTGQWKNLIVAYEPVWAIGTGQTATPEQAREMHAFIRSEIQNLSDENIATSIRILYGGSVKPSNAEAIFSQPHVDGGLIGGASLKAEDFLSIIQQAESLQK